MDETMRQLRDLQFEKKKWIRQIHSLKQQDILIMAKKRQIDDMLRNIDLYRDEILKVTKAMQQYTERFVILHYYSLALIINLKLTIRGS